MKKFRVIYITPLLFNVWHDFNHTFDRKNITNVGGFNVGGYGSGGYRWGVRRTPVENCVVLDVNWLARDGVFYRGEPLHLQFRSIVTTAVLYDQESSEVLLTYQVLNGDPVEQIITATRSACHLGGFRNWLTCPQCGKRAAKLYLPVNASDRSIHRGFACRQCLGLSYAVRNIKNKFRLARLRETRIQKRLQKRDIPINEFLPKPKRMHWRNYRQYVADLTAARRETNESLIQDFAEHFPETLNKFMRATGEPNKKAHAS